VGPDCERVKIHYNLVPSFTLRSPNGLFSRLNFWMLHIRGGLISVWLYKENKKLRD
jgi:hypothetical protein